MKNVLVKWWRGLLYEPGDPRLMCGSNLKVVVIGGGTGLAVLLRGLKQYSDSISAIVAVTDDGSSSGQIRKEFDILPPGDIRKCISALAYDESLISKIMEFRFSDDKKNLGGHTLGNLWITALTEYFGSFEKAIEKTTEIFETAGKVLPATLDNINLGAIYIDGSQNIGESKIPIAGKKIQKVFLTKSKVEAYHKAVKAILEADLIIFGPGSLYTSVLPNLLIEGIQDALRENTHSENFYICNCSTERGETENYSVRDHIKSIYKHCGGKVFDYCLVNNKILKVTKDDSELGGVNNITTDKNIIEGCKVVLTDLVSEENPLYHDSDKLAKNVIDLYNKVKAH